ALPFMLQALEAVTAPPVEVAIMGAVADPVARGLIEAVRSTYLPNRVFASLDPAHPRYAEIAAAVPLLAGKALVDGGAAAYVCRDFVCKKPVTNAEELVRVLRAETRNVFEGEDEQ
ncbi:MAG: hypothetical protein HQ559_15495, partial [Lentisphaerae bacterium]|nr:hypothetical protein [Lentisphaerota bacterium]